MSGCPSRQYDDSCTGHHAEVRLLDLTTRAHLGEHGHIWHNDSPGVTTGPTNRDVDAMPPHLRDRPRVMPPPVTTLRDGRAVYAADADPVDVTSDTMFVADEVARRWHGRDEVSRSERARAAVQAACSLHRPGRVIAWSVVLWHPNTNEWSVGLWTVPPSPVREGRS